MHALKDVRYATYRQAADGAGTAPWRLVGNSMFTIKEVAEAAYDRALEKHRGQKVTLAFVQLDITTVRTTLKRKGAPQ